MENHPTCLSKPLNRPKLLLKVNGIPKFYVERLTHWADFAKVDSSHHKLYVYLGEILWFNFFIQISNQSFVTMMTSFFLLLN